MSLARVKAGSAIRANDFNKIIENVNVRFGQPNAQSARAQMSLKNLSGATVCAAGNVSDTEIPYGAPVTIIEQLQFPGSDNTLLAVQPYQEGDDNSLLAVAMEAIPGEGIGLISIGGVAWIYTDGTSGAFATPTANGNYTLGASGPLIVISNAGQSYMALARFNIGSSSISSVPIFFGSMTPHGHFTWWEGYLSIYAGGR